jgi:hypothetical protein
MVVKDSSPTTSEKYVIAIRVNIWNTELGITSKLVLKVSKPSPFRDSVKYCVGGVVGKLNRAPITYNGHRS